MDQESQRNLFKKADRVKIGKMIMYGQRTIQNYNHLDK